ncbi:hypothetical protein ANN_22466 [Periplaneta americana]|uniref:protein-L-isoaspartate(D-aspartate) O-methyltransferase n=1 Tax=Periplaneta americana TaxID=6978 RepID=A0ABQ8S883_PERAM|nr:hypothetical protein ANN_22466 [Periplaneta americana]
MSPESSTESYPAFVHIGLRENPGKNLNQEACPDWEPNPGHLVSQPDALTFTPQRKRDPLLVDRDDIIAWRHSYLQFIKRHRVASRSIMCIDETWINAGSTTFKSWIDKTVTSALDARRKLLTTGNKLTSGKSGRITKNGVIPEAQMYYGMAWRSHGRDNADMVRNLRANGIIRSQIVEDVMLKVDRGKYAKFNPYMDAPQGIGYGVTISAPHMICKDKEKKKAREEKDRSKGNIEFSQLWPSSSENCKRSLKSFALEGYKGTGFICVGVKSFSCDTSIPVFQMLKETNDADYEVQAKNTPDVRMTNIDDDEDDDDDDDDDDDGNGDKAEDTISFSP